MGAIGRLAVLLAMLGLAGPINAQSFTEYPVSKITQGSIIVAGPDGALYFYGDQGTVNRITTSGSTTLVAQPPNTAYNGMTLGPDGNLWLSTGASENLVFRISTSGTVASFNVGDPNSIVATIAKGPDGNLYFSTVATNFMNRISPAGAITKIALPDPNADVENITAGPDGAIWFSIHGTNPQKIGRMTVGGSFTSYPFSGPGLGAARMIAGPDGAVWYGGSDRIGRIDATGVMTEYLTGFSNSSPNALAFGPDGALYFTTSFLNQIWRFGLDSQNFTHYDVPTANSGPVGLTL